MRKAFFDEFSGGPCSNFIAQRLRPTLPSVLRWIVTLTGADAQIGPIWRAYGDAFESAAGAFIRRIIPEQILRLKFFGNLAEDPSQFLDLCQIKGLASGLRRHRFHNALTFEAHFVELEPAAARVD